QKTSAELLRITVSDFGDDCSPDAPKDSDFACTKQTLAKAAVHKRAADGVLAALGFEKRDTQWLQRPEGETFTSADKKTTIAFRTKDDASEATIKRGDATVTIKDVEAPVFALAFAGDVVVLVNKESWGCGGADSQRTLSTTVSVSASGIR